MDLSIVSIACTVATLLQGTVACLALKDRFVLKDNTYVNNHAGSIAAVTAIGIVFTIFTGFWVHYNPPPPKIKTIYIDKPLVVPCPTTSQSNGSATTRGANSPAHSGNNDTYGLPQPLAQPQR